MHLKRDKYTFEKEKANILYAKNASNTLLYTAITLQFFVNIAVRNEMDMTANAINFI